LLDDLGDRRGYSYLKEEALDRIKWRNHFGRDCGPVVWHITDDDEATYAFWPITYHVSAIAKVIADFYALNVTYLYKTVNTPCKSVYFMLHTWDSPRPATKAARLAVRDRDLLSSLLNLYLLNLPPFQSLEVDQWTLHVPFSAQRVAY
jgi:hypothetical protein